MFSVCFPHARFVAEKFFSESEDKKLRPFLKMAFFANSKPPETSIFYDQKVKNINKTALPVSQFKGKVIVEKIGKYVKWTLLVLYSPVND